VTSTLVPGSENAVAFSSSSARRWAAATTWPPCRAGGGAQHVRHGGGLTRSTSVLPAGEHQQGLGTTAQPHGEVVELEQLAEDGGVLLRLLEPVEGDQLAVEQGQVATGRGTSGRGVRAALRAGVRGGRRRREDRCERGLRLGDGRGRHVAGHRCRRCSLRGDGAAATAPGPTEPARQTGEHERAEHDAGVDHLRREIRRRGVGDDQGLAGESCGRQGAGPGHGGGDLVARHVRQGPQLGRCRRADVRGAQQQERPVGGVPGDGEVQARDRELVGPGIELGAGRADRGDHRAAALREVGGRVGPVIGLDRGHGGVERDHGLVGGGAGRGQVSAGGRRGELGSQCRRDDGRPGEGVLGGVLDETARLEPRPAADLGGHADRDDDHHDGEGTRDDAADDG
jgi:hypothetical protein